MALVCNPADTGTDMRPAKKARFAAQPESLVDLDLGAANEELRHASADDAIKYALKHCGDAVALTTSLVLPPKPGAGCVLPSFTPGRDRWAGALARSPMFHAPITSSDG